MELKLIIILWKKKNLYISFYQQEEDIFTFLLDLLRDSRFEKNG